MSKQQELTAHQKLVRAAARGTGLRLSPEDVHSLGGCDIAICTRAQVDCEHQGIDPEPLIEHGLVRRVKQEAPNDR